MWPFNNILEELGSVEGSKLYINVKLWRSSIRLMKAFLNLTTDLLHVLSSVSACACLVQIRMS